MEQYPEIQQDEPVYFRPGASDFDLFYRRELASVVAVVYGLCGNRWAAEDIAHDAFAVCCRRWEKVGGYERPGAFVRRVAINLAHSRARRLEAEAKAVARYATGQAPTVGPIEPTDRDFWEEVRRLPRRQREIVVLRYVEDCSDSEIEDILGCSEATVRVHFHRAKQTLAKALRLQYQGEIL